MQSRELWGPPRGGFSMGERWEGPCMAAMGSCAWGMIVHVCPEPVPRCWHLCSRIVGANTVGSASRMRLYWQKSQKPQNWNNVNAWLVPSGNSPEDCLQYS